MQSYCKRSLCILSVCQIPMPQNRLTTTHIAVQMIKTDYLLNLPTNFKCTCLQEYFPYILSTTLIQLQTKTPFNHSQFHGCCYNKASRTSKKWKQSFNSLVAIENSLCSKKTSSPKQIFLENHAVVTISGKTRVESSSCLFCSRSPNPDTELYCGAVHKGKCMRISLNTYLRLAFKLGAWH